MADTEQNPNGGKFKCEITVGEKPEGYYRPEVNVEIEIENVNFPNRPYLKGVNLLMPIDRETFAKENAAGFFQNMRRVFAEEGIKRTDFKEQLEPGDIILPGAIYTEAEPYNSDVSYDGDFTRVFILKKRVFNAAVVLGGSLILFCFVKNPFFLMLSIFGAFGLFLFSKKTEGGRSDHTAPSNLFRVRCLVNKLVFDGFIDSDNEERFHYQRRSSTDIFIQKKFYLPWRSGDKPDYSDYIEAFKKIPEILKKQLLSGAVSGKTEKITISVK